MADGFVIDLEAEYILVVVDRVRHVERFAKPEFAAIWILIQLTFSNCEDGPPRARIARCIPSELSVWKNIMEDPCTPAPLLQGVVAGNLPARI